MDFQLVERYPNKYNLTTSGIKKLKIFDWEKLKEHTWYNNAKNDTGKWWCHLEGCNLDGKYDDYNEFWIGFNEVDDTIDLHFICWDGMGKYLFEEFYKDIESKYDLYVQVNAIKFLNMLLDENILKVQED
jgi:hypothetical protein